MGPGADSLEQMLSWENSWLSVAMTKLMATGLPSKRVMREKT